ncbi:OmpA family protein [Runella sp.]|uniref:OmpA family protein n=1 Tax=Runella sp. TaxID=1960881 RepID=UPI003D0D232C
MKRLRYFLGLFLLLSIETFAQKLTTLSPYVEKQSQYYVNITKVELTNDYTILYFTLDFNTAARPRSLEDIILGNRTTPDIIEIDPNCRLYEPGNASRKFRFIKAEGIPVAPQTRKIYQGDVVKFVVYFERLDPGIEEFDMYEGQDQGTRKFWNYFGVHIRNPKRPLPKKQPVPEPKNAEPPVVAEAPKETPLPTEPKKESAPQLVTLRGTVIDAKTKQPIAAKITYLLPGGDNGLDSMQLSASSGRFKLNLDAGNKYAYVATAKGHFPTSGAFDLTQAKGGQEVENEIVLNPVAVGEAITLNNIYFDISKFDLLPSSFAEMDRLTQLMRENPNMEIKVEGHTDNLGDFDKNVELSQNRANAVKKYLVSKGIDAQRIEAKGLGPTRPVTKGTSESERRRNRRVEFVVVKM